MQSELGYDRDGSIGVCVPETSPHRGCGSVARKTLRKRLIREVLEQIFDGGPVVQEELRWHVFIKEQDWRDKPWDRMSRSYRTSFNRTLRQGVAGVAVSRFSIRSLNKIPGLVAKRVLVRCGVHREAASESLKRLGRYRVTLWVRSHRVVKVRGNPRAVFIRIYLQEEDKSVRFPVSKPVTLLSMGALDMVALRAYARQVRGTRLLDTG